MHKVAGKLASGLIMLACLSCARRPAPPAAAPYKPEEQLTPADIRLKIVGTWKRSGPTSPQDPVTSLTFTTDGTMVMNRVGLQELSGRWSLLPRGNNIFLINFDGTDYLSEYIIFRLDDHEFEFKAFEPSAAPPPVIQRYTR